MQNIEEKLDNIIELLERNNTLLEYLDKSLENVKRNLPETPYFDTKKIEKLLESIYEHLESNA